MIFSVFALKLDKHVKMEFLLATDRTQNMCVDTWPENFVGALSLELQQIYCGDIVLITISYTKRVV